MNNTTKVYSQADLAFVADQAAETDALLTFLIASIRSADSFIALQRTLESGLKQVSITQTIDVEEYLKSQNSGYVAVVKAPLSDISDYFRNDDGLPVIFPRKDSVFIEIPKDFELVRIIDLEERHER